MFMAQGKGVRQLVWLPKDLFELTEKTRKKLGMSKSGFYRYAIIDLLRGMGAFSNELIEDIQND